MMMKMARAMRCLQVAMLVLPEPVIPAGAASYEQRGGDPPSGASAVALFHPAQGVLPYPTDLYFKRSKDGTLNITPLPASPGRPAGTLTPVQSAVNALDGFSTTSVIRERFSAPLDAGSLGANAVHLIQVEIDNASKLVIRAHRVLEFGKDFAAGVAGDSDSGGTILEIRPLRPLTPSSGVNDIGYLVVLTNTIKSVDGRPTRSDGDFATITAALNGPGCKTIGDASLRGICAAVGSQRKVAVQSGIDWRETTLTFSFSTGSTVDTLKALADPAVTTARPISVASTGLVTKDLDPQLPGHATVYRGTIEIPFYSTRPTRANPTAPLTTSWRGGPSPLDAASTFLTRFNPLPIATETISIPILVTVPNASAAGGGKKPAKGWPVLIYQHGLTRNRLDALQVADAFADADADSTVQGRQGYVVAAIDLPLHGITDPASPLYDAANERTFNLDLVNNTTLAPGPDGHIDPTGTFFINVSSVLTTRDNLREAVADLLTLTRSLPGLDVDGDGLPDIDSERIHFLGQSLGAVVGGVFLGAPGSGVIRTGGLASPGGELVPTVFDSPTFGPQFTGMLASQGIQAGTTAFAEFVRDAQNAVDAGDPDNYILAAATSHPLLVFQVVGGGTLRNGERSPPDQVISNTSTQRLIDAAGLRRICALGANPGASGFVNFVFGIHGSIFDPTASPPTTAEMRRESTFFANAMGRIVQVTDRTVVQTSDCTSSASLKNSW
jgi:hypothetical protein